MSPPPSTSLALLPLANASGNPEVDYFASGLTDLLYGSLSGVRALRVSSRGAASALQGQLAGPELGRALDVSAILDGSVSRLGNQVRLSVQLSDATDGGTLWSSKWDIALDELFPTLGEIVRHVLEALHVEPTSEERPALAHVPTRDPTALDAYLRAREVSEEIRRASQDVVVHLYGDAVLADASFGLAHAGLANAHALLFTYWVSSDEHLQAADASSARAVELAPELAEAHVARAVALSLNKQHEAAERAFQTALALRPGLFEAHYHYARHHRTLGRFDDSARWFESAAALRPEDYAVPALLASVYVGLRRPEEAQAAQRRALKLAEQRLKRVPDDERALYLGAGCLSSLGDPSRAREWAKRAVAMEPDDSAVLYNVACVYALLGLKDSAIDCLERALANGFGHWEWIAHDSDLDALRAHPRFTALTPR
jgi:TolB-like protein/Tfp pilus assembly protein PilF